MGDNRITNFSKTAWTTGQDAVEQVKKKYKTSTEKLGTASREFVSGLEIDTRKIAKIVAFMAVTAVALAVIQQLARAAVSTGSPDAPLKDLSNVKTFFGPENNPNPLIAEVRDVVVEGTTRFSNYVGDPDENIDLSFLKKDSTFSLSTSFASKIDVTIAREAKFEKETGYVVITENVVVETNAKIENVEVAVKEELSGNPTPVLIASEQVKNETSPVVADGKFDQKLEEQEIVSALVVAEASVPVMFGPEAQEAEVVPANIVYPYETKDGFIHLYPSYNKCPLTDRALEIWGVSRERCAKDGFLQDFMNRIGNSACVRAFNLKAVRDGNKILFMTSDGLKTTHELALEDSQHPLSCGKEGFNSFGTPQGYLAADNPLGAEPGKCYAQAIVGLNHADVNLIGKDGSVTMLGYYPKARYERSELLTTIIPVDGGFISPPPYIDGKGYWSPWSKIVQIPCEGKKSLVAAIDYAKQPGFSYQLLNWGGEKTMNCFGAMVKLLKEAGVPILNFARKGTELHHIGRYVKPVPLNKLLK